MKYAYPAVFTPEDEGGYSVNFPDLEGCYTCGDSKEDAVYMAEDVLAMTLCYYERHNIPIPEPSNPIPEGKDFVETIHCDTTGYPLVEENE